MIRSAILALLLTGPGFAQLTFEVASIKPADPDSRGTSIQFMPGGGLKMTGIPLRGMITFAYDVRDFQVSGGPGWAGTERFDVMARPDRTTVDGPDDFAKMTDDQRKTMRDQITERLRALLADRFQLVAHKEMKEQPIYALVPAKNGPKLQETKETGTQQSLMTNRGRSEGHAIQVGMLAQVLSGLMGRPVVDKTGLTGKYDFVLEWTPDAGADARAQGFGDGITEPAPAPGGPTIFTALQEQLGLRLDSQKGPVPNIVIDRVEKPSEN
ncbi:MAG: TIGR03435 family protein [Acidobacteriia bacterium]|nr:TIGR03435 family protein [Terriglobia bacterium]